MEQSIDELKGSLEAFYKDMTTRLHSHDDRSTIRPRSRGLTSKDTELETKAHCHMAHPNRLANGFEFDRDLKESRVYRKIPFDDPSSALSLDESHSTNWSHLSSISLAEVSHISVISLLIGLDEIYNPSYYRVSIDFQDNRHPWESRDPPEGYGQRTVSKSSIEIAGSLLSVFPSLVGRFVDLKRTGALERSSRTLVSISSTYQNSIEYLLLQIMAKQELSGLLDSPLAVAWRDPSIHMKIRVALGPAFEKFCLTIQSVREQTTKTQHLVQASVSAVLSSYYKTVED